MKWYLKYFWVKINILILTPLVWIEKKYQGYKQFKLEFYVKSQCM